MSALHVLQLLADDIGKIRDAPSVIRDLRDQVGPEAVRRIVRKVSSIARELDTTQHSGQRLQRPRGGEALQCDRRKRSTIAFRESY